MRGVAWLSLGLFLLSSLPPVGVATHDRENPWTTVEADANGIAIWVDGIGYLIGGFTPMGDPLGIRVFDPSDGSLTQVAVLPGFYYSAPVQFGNHLYFLEDQDVYKFDLLTHVVTETGDQVPAALYPSLGISDGERIHFALEYCDGDLECPMFAYDPATGDFELEPMATSGSLWPEESPANLPQLNYAQTVTVDDLTYVFNAGFPITDEWGYLRWDYSAILTFDAAQQEFVQVGALDSTLDIVLPAWDGTSFWVADNADYYYYDVGRSSLQQLDGSFETQQRLCPGLAMPGASSFGVVDGGAYAFGYNQLASVDLEDLWSECPFLGKDQPVFVGNGQLELVANDFAWGLATGPEANLPGEALSSEFPYVSARASIASYSSGGLYSTAQANFGSGPFSFGYLADEPNLFETEEGLELHWGVTPRSLLSDLVAGQPPEQASFTEPLNTDSLIVSCQGGFGEVQYFLRFLQDEDLVAEVLETDVSIAGYSFGCDTVDEHAAETLDIVVYELPHEDQWYFDADGSTDVTVGDVRLSFVQLPGFWAWPESTVGAGDHDLTAERGAPPTWARSYGLDDVAVLGSYSNPHEWTPLALQEDGFRPTLTNRDLLINGYDRHAKDLEDHFRVTQRWSIGPEPSLANENNSFLHEEIEVCNVAAEPLLMGVRTSLPLDDAPGGWTHALADDGTLTSPSATTLVGDAKSDRLVSSSFGREVHRILSDPGAELPVPPTPADHLAAGHGWLNWGGWEFDTNLGTDFQVYDHASVLWWGYETPIAVASGECESVHAYYTGHAEVGDDGDAVPTGEDNCPAVPNDNQADWDNDGFGDACDTSNDDVDGDGVDNLDDNCDFDENPGQEDGDGDSMGDACDLGEPTGDADSDLVPNEEDNCPLEPNANQHDSNDNGVGDACEPAFEPVDTDSDGLDDGEDNCFTVPNEGQADLDEDGLGDACDSDMDGDGVPQVDGADLDNCPVDANPDQADSDLDDVGDACDIDDDNDTKPDDLDNCPTVANSGQSNIDADSLGDECDTDDDGDGDLDGADNCPLHVNGDQLNSDGDLLGNACDPDDDNDGDLDVADNCPVHSNGNQADRDGDNVGNVCDNDRDGDGHVNAADNCPDDANPGQADSVGDGVGDACRPQDTSDLQKGGYDYTSPGTTPTSTVSSGAAPETYDGNQAPHVDLGETEAHAVPGVDYVIPFVARDADGDILTVTATSLPPGVTLADGRLTFNTNHLGAGRHCATVTVRDPYGATDTRTACLTLTLPGTGGTGTSTGKVGTGTTGTGLGETEPASDAPRACLGRGCLDGQRDPNYRVEVGTNAGGQDRSTEPRTDGTEAATEPEGEDAPAGFLLPVGLVAALLWARRRAV